MTLIKCKVVRDKCSYADYHRQKARRGDRRFSMSRSELVDFTACPAKWIAGPGEDDSSKSTVWGSLIDCLVTQPKQFDTLFVVRPDTYEDEITGQLKPFSRASRLCRKWIKSKLGLTIISNQVMRDAEAAVKSIKADPAVVELLKVSRKQVLVTGVWRDKETKLNIPLRALIDLVPAPKHPVMGKWLADFKTARSGDPAAWSRVVDDCGYDVQAALYLDLYLAATGEDRTDWVFAVQENVAPFHVTSPMPSLSQEFLEWGRIKYQSALRYYCQCLRANQWPSYQVHGMRAGPIQIIGPDDLWQYKQLAGHGSLQR